MPRTVDGYENLRSFEEESSNEMDLASEDGNVNNMFDISFQFS